MSKYDHLDASTELEQSITADLKTALEKRGCTVTHNSKTARHSPGGRADITVTHPDFVFTLEATKSKGAQQDREVNAIRAHLN